MAAVAAMVLNRGFGQAVKGKVIGFIPGGLLQNPSTVIKS
jgi:hypothetical protein